MSTQCRTRSYAALSHLCNAYWLNHDPARCWVIAYTAYYDASGQEGEVDAPLVVAGVIAREDKWNKLEVDWKAHLAKFGVPYLHMKEWNKKGGQYAALRSDPEAERDFLDGTVRLTKKHVNKIFFVRLIPADFHALTDEFMLPEAVGGPYALTASATISHIERWMKLKHPGQRILHLVEDGDDGQHHLHQMQRNEPNPAIIRPSIDERGERLVPFQVADCLAYEHRLDVKRRWERDKRDRRQFLIRQRLQLPISPLQIDQEVIRHLCEQSPEMFPRRDGATSPSASSVSP